MQQENSRFENYIDELREDVYRLRQEQGEGAKKSFVLTMCSQVPDSDMDDVHPLYVNQKIGSRKIALDGYVFNSEERTLTLIVADWNGFKSEDNLTATEAEALLKVLRTFFELSRGRKLAGVFEFSTPEFELDELIQSEAIDRIHLLIFTDRKVSDRIRHLKSDPIEEIQTDSDIWGPERLYDFVCSNKTQEPLYFDFSDIPIPLTLATVGEGYKSYQGVMPATILAALYREYGGRLLEGNVRSFLTLKTSVNKDIRGTILGQPEKFFIFNNGIAVTVRKVEFNKAGEMVGATDLQIINGGQTTASLARAAMSDKADLSKIQVAMKLTFISEDLPEEEALALMQNISRFSNNQNKVSGADFSSNHPLHIRIEKCSERIVAPPAPGVQYGSYWFYERNRGSYDQKKMFLRGDKLREFERKYSKKQKVRKEDLAKVRLCWDQKPDIVSKGAQTLFAKFMSEVNETWKEDDSKGVYGEQYFKDSIALIIMYKQLSEAVSTQHWYDSGYRANIVAYTISVFSLFFQSFHGKDSFDFSLIWKKQSLPEDMLGVLLQIARRVKEEVLTFKERAKENVTEWAKMKQCWILAQEIFKQNGVTLPSSSSRWVVSCEKRESAKRDSRTEARRDAGIEIQQQVLRYLHWKDAMIFDRQHSVLSPMQSRSVSKATMIPNKLPNEKECALAMQALELLRQEGFKY